LIGVIITFVCHIALILFIGLHCIHSVICLTRFVMADLLPLTRWVGERVVLRIRYEY
jgi:hypothetical protein